MESSISSHSKEVYGGPKVPKWLNKEPEMSKVNVWIVISFISVEKRHFSFLKLFYLSGFFRTNFILDFISIIVLFCHSFTSHRIRNKKIESITPTPMRRFCPNFHFPHIPPVERTNSKSSWLGSKPLLRFFQLFIFPSTNWIKWKLSSCITSNKKARTRRKDATWHLQGLLKLSGSKSQSYQPRCD